MVEAFVKGARAADATFGAGWFNWPVARRPPKKPQLPSTVRWRYSVTYSGWLTRSGSPSTTYPASGWRRSRRAG